MAVCHGIRDPKHNISTITAVIHLIDWILANFILYSLAWLLMLKYWLIHYNVEWTRFTMNSKWIIHLNHSAVSDNWYLRNKRKYGNFTYCIKRLAVFLVILFGFNVIDPLIFGDNDAVFNTLMAIITNLFPVVIIVLYLKMHCSKFEDNFYVMKEMRYITICVIGGFISFGIVGTVPVYLGATRIQQLFY